MGNPRILGKEEGEIGHVALGSSAVGGREGLGRIR